MRKLVQIFLLVFSCSIHSAIIGSGLDNYCIDHQDSNFLRELPEESQNLLNFKNDGGILNQGVCWWHSRFQRNLLYLAYFSPDKTIVPKNLVMSLLNQIKKGESVVEIPGFSNVEDFTRYYQSEIQKLLNQWQIIEGGLQGGWQRGVRGKSKVSSDELKMRMEELFHYVERKNKIAYTKLQIKGIVAHAWLVHKMKATDTGYILSIIDSNNPQNVETYEYKFGDTSFFVKGYGNFVPYLEFKTEEERLLAAKTKRCQALLSNSLSLN